eukprot:TRINITY_DN12226_c0_g1_i1.p1 TRINITY_DN12226_c0_g1~~TRINITY_DN12226_c0_g1_i1.p1  ORF type:complete len:656 (+),score=65.19 TRINITY_DN12226_c0_g1_i1:102-2069(+)
MAQPLLAGTRLARSETWEVERDGEDLLINNISIPKKAAETTVVEYATKLTEPAPIEHCVGPAVPWAWQGVKAVWGSLLFNVIVVLTFVKRDEHGIAFFPLFYAFPVMLMASAFGTYCDVKCMRYAIVPFLQEAGQNGLTIFGIPVGYGAFINYTRFVSFSQMLCIQVNVFFVLQVVMSRDAYKGLWAYLVELSPLGNLGFQYIDITIVGAFVLVCELLQVVVPLLTAMPYPFKRLIREVRPIDSPDSFAALGKTLLIKKPRDHTSLRDYRNVSLRSICAVDARGVDVTDRCWGAGAQCLQYPLQITFERELTWFEWEAIHEPRKHDHKNTAYSWYEYAKMTWYEGREGVVKYQTPQRVKDMWNNSDSVVLTGALSGNCLNIAYNNPWSIDYAVDPNPSYFTSIGTEMNLFLVSDMDRNWEDHAKVADKNPGQSQLSYMIFPQEALSLLGSAVGMKGVGSIDVSYRLAQVRHMQKYKLGFGGPDGWEYRAILRLLVLHRIVMKRLVIGLLFKQSVMVNLQIMIYGINGAILQEPHGINESSCKRLAALGLLMLTTLSEASVVYSIVSAFIELRMHVKDASVGYPSPKCRTTLAELHDKYKHAKMNTLLLVIVLGISAWLNFYALSKFVAMNFVCSSGLVEFSAAGCLTEAQIRAHV